MNLADVEIAADLSRERANLKALLKHCEPVNSYPNGLLLSEFEDEDLTISRDFIDNHAPDRIKQIEIELGNLGVTVDG